MDERSETNQTPETAQQQPATGAADETAALRAQLEAQARRLDEVTRAYAEILNDRESYRRRADRERERQVESARADAAAALFDAVDQLRLALQNSGGESSAVIDGVRMIAEGLERRLAAMGITPIPTVGQYFDPNLHEAIDLAPTNDRDTDGKVIDETRGGWKLGDRVVRAARVRVARFVPAASPDGEEPLPS